MTTFDHHSAKAALHELTETVSWLEGALGMLKSERVKNELFDARDNLRILEEELQAAKDKIEFLVEETNDLTTEIADAKKEKT